MRSIYPKVTELVGNIAAAIEARHTDLHVIEIEANVLTVEHTDGTAFLVTVETMYAPTESVLPLPDPE